jgi:hypothetical protein
MIERNQRMIRSRLGLKVLGLCAVLVGMFAFTGAAQAETGSLWKIGGAQAKGGELVEGSLEGTSGTLLTTLGGKAIHLKCTALALVGAKLVEPNGGITGKIDFSGCDFLSLKTVGGELVLQKACEPNIEGKAGLIITNTIDGLIVLHTPTGGKAEGVLEAKGLPDFATIQLGAEGKLNECAFGEKLLVGGVFFLKDCEGKFSTELAKHLVQELPALTKLVINEGTTPATIDGSAFAFLGSPNVGKLWAGIPN